MSIGVTATVEVGVHVGEIRADTEVLALAGEHHRVGLLVVDDGFVELAQLEVHLRAQRVAPLGTVQRDDEHIVGELGLDRLQAIAVGHRCVSPHRLVSSARSS